jgi:hypothetical protein
LKQAAVFLCLFVGVLLEQHLWDETIMESPNELTVTDFELAEEGFSVVLTNALEDARALVEHLTYQHDCRQAAWVKSNSVPNPTIDLDLMAKAVADAAEMQFRAMRVLGLLEAAREREAGGVS